MVFKKFIFNITFHIKSDKTRHFQILFYNRNSKNRNAIFFSILVNLAIENK